MPHPAFPWPCPCLCLCPCSCPCPCPSFAPSSVTVRGHRQYITGVEAIARAKQVPRGLVFPPPSIRHTNALGVGLFSPPTSATPNPTPTSIATASLGETDGGDAEGGERDAGEEHRELSHRLQHLVEHGPHGHGCAGVEHVGGGRGQALHRDAAELVGVPEHEAPEKQRPHVRPLRSESAGHGGGHVARERRRAARDQPPASDAQELRRDVQDDEGGHGETAEAAKLRPPGPAEQRAEAEEEQALPPLGGHEHL